MYSQNSHLNFQLKISSGGSIVRLSSGSLLYFSKCFMIILLVFIIIMIYSFNFSIIYHIYDSISFIASILTATSGTELRGSDAAACGGK